MIMIKLAIMASGSGTNAENIIQYFQGHPTIKVTEVLSNKHEAYVHKRAEKLGVPSRTFSKTEFRDQAFLHELNADYLILAGFLWLIPTYLVQGYPDRIINIHPALLPKFGGKGMYGSHVHRSVIDAQERESGITIHLVDEEYDKGKILFQAKCEVGVNDDADSLAKKIHQLEYDHFPKVIEDYVLNH